MAAEEGRYKEAAREQAELALSEGVKFEMSLRVVESVPMRFEARR
jgi:hypothetical protein